MENELQGEPAIIQDPLFSLEELTVTTSRGIEDMKRDLKEARQMVKEQYEANESYQSVVKALTELKQQLGQVKEQLNGQPQTAGMIQKAKDIQTEIKEKSAAVSDYALEYMRMAGKGEIEKDGITYTIIRTAKLVKSL